MHSLIKPQSLSDDEGFKTAVQALWRDWVEEADAAGQTDFYGLQALACRAMLEGGECLIRLRPRRPEDGLSVPLQLQLLERSICRSRSTPICPLPEGLPAQATRCARASSSYSDRKSVV